MKHGCMWKYLQIWSIHMHWESYPISGLFPTRFSFLFHGTVDLNAFLLLRVEALDAFDFGQFYNDRISMATQKVHKSLYKCRIIHCNRHRDTVTCMCRKDGNGKYMFKKTRSSSVGLRMQQSCWKRLCLVAATNHFRWPSGKNKHSFSNSHLN